MTYNEFKNNTLALSKMFKGAKFGNTDADEYFESALILSHMSESKRLGLLPGFMLGIVFTGTLLFLAMSIWRVSC